MPSPHVFRIARARAKSDDGCAHFRTRSHQFLESPRAVVTDTQIRMDHVEGARYRGQTQLVVHELTANLIGQRGVDLFRQRRQTDTGEIELDALDAVLGDGLQQLACRWAGERSRKNSNSHFSAIIGGPTQRLNFLYRCSLVCRKLSLTHPTRRREALWRSRWERENRSPFSRKFAQLDLSDGPLQTRKRTMAVPSPRGRRSG